MSMKRKYGSLTNNQQFINNDFDRNIMLNEQDKIAQIISDNIIKDYNVKHEDSKIVTQELPMYDGSIVPIKITYY